MKFYFIVLLVLLFGTLCAQQIGGPYTVDDSTMLLMHFDGDLTNVSTYSADGVGHGTLYYIPNNVSGLGQCLRVENDDQQDSSFVTVADTVYLDLTGNWTIEGWINIFTFGTGPSDWRWVPRLSIKTGDAVFWRPNWFSEMWGSSRFFSNGYHTASQDAWPQVNTPENTLEVGQWFHLTFIRDTTNHLLLGLVHDSNRDLVNFNAVDYTTFGAADPTPITTDMPVHIGFAGGGGDSWLDGFVDEIRISNMVREFPTPPIITNVTQMTNQPSSVTQYDIDATMFTLFSSTIQTASLFYSINGAAFTEVSMNPGAGNLYSATIPGQSTGAVIDYYVKAVDDGGLSFTQPQTAETDSSYYSFGIFTLETQTLGLDFETGSGVPQDNSPYNQTVRVAGLPVYSTNSAVGTYSIYLEGDSSYLEVDSPFLSSDSFCIDLWLNADSLRDYCRIFNRPADPGVWYQNNYQVRFDNAQHFQCISDGSVSLTFDEFLVETGQWYHIIYEVQNAPAGDTVTYYGVAEIRDGSDNLIVRKFAGFDQTVLNAQSPLRIGKSTDGDYPPYFPGYFDDIKVYNYPQAGLPLTYVVNTIDDESPELPFNYSLAQNYPNPFNPNTEIQFTLARTENVALSVYNILGKKIKTLVNEERVAGEHKIIWNGTNDYGSKVATGVYLYKIETDNFVKVRKMVLVK